MESKGIFYLKHHGIEGQKWGVENGPPYPLDDKDHSAAEKKAGWRQSLDKKETWVQIRGKNKIPISVDNKPNFRQRHVRMKTQNADGSLNSKGIKRYEVNKYGYMSKKGLDRFEKDTKKMDSKYMRNVVDRLPKSFQRNAIETYLKESRSSAHKNVREQISSEMTFGSTQRILKDLNKNGKAYVMMMNKNGVAHIAAADSDNRRYNLEGYKIVNSMEDVMALRPLH